MLTLIFFLGLYIKSLNLLNFGSLTFIFGSIRSIHLERNEFYI